MEISKESSEGDWTEDSNHENGNYRNICFDCRLEFTGHKRRVICKACSKNRINTKNKMEALKQNEQSVEIVLTPSDVESAVRQFICTCYPEYAKDWVLNAKYNVGTVIMAGTKL